jgi:hypothetical protein
VTGTHLPWGISILINKKFKKRSNQLGTVNENIITVNLNHLGTKTAVLCVYAPSNDKVNLQKEQFCEKVNETLVNIGTTREIILLGNFNGHTCTKVNNQVVGPYGVTRRNDKHTRNLKSIIDYLIVKQKSKFQIHYVRVQRSINYGSDHCVVRAKVYLQIQGRKSNMDKHEENYEKVMYLKYNLDSIQHESTQYVYRKITRSKTESK